MPSTFAKEAKSLNTFLKPFVDELQLLWKGVNLTTYVHPAGVEVRAALLCIAADSPAARKVSGFNAHNAIYGCMKCLKKFPGRVGEKKSYAGYDCNCWPVRMMIQHYKQAMSLLRCKSKSARQDKEREYGLKYSILIELPYMDVIRFTILDPMHAIFLGTVKHIIKLLVDLEIIDEDDLIAIDVMIQDVYRPSDAGRVPRGFVSNWKQFTAAEFKNFLLAFAGDVLKEIVPTKYYVLIMKLADACIRICKPCVLVREAKEAHNLFIQFGKEFEKVFGKQYVTPNMHGHAHLFRLLIDYGSPHSFWLFAFERCNGKQADTPTNGKCIEVQLMKRFLLDDFLFQQKATHDTMAGEVVEALKGRNQPELPQVSTDIVLLPTKKLSECRDLWSQADSIHLAKTCTFAMFDEDDMLLLAQTYMAMYPSAYIHLPLPTTHKCYKTANILGQHYCSLSGSSKCLYVFAKWSLTNGSVGESKLRLGKIWCFFKHCVDIDGVTFFHVMAKVQWLTQVSENTGHLPPTTVWHINRYIPPGPSSYIPAHRIFCRAAYAERVVNGYKCIVASPLQPKVYI